MGVPGERHQEDNQRNQDETARIGSHSRPDLRIAGEGSEPRPHGGIGHDPVFAHQAVDELRLGVLLPLPVPFLRQALADLGKGRACGGDICVTLTRCSP